MSTASNISRVIHQYRVEWHHQWILVLLWLAILTLGQSPILVPLISAIENTWIEVTLLFIAAILIWRCVSADAPSNTDTFSLTRPLGQGALWCGKLLFIFSSIVIPLLLVMSLDWRGFGLGVAQWVVMSLVIVLAISLCCAVVGSVTALASSSRQVLAIAILAVIGAGVWIAIPKPWIAQKQFTIETKLCGSLIGSVVAFAGLMIAWWIATVPRLRFYAVAIAIITLLGSNWVSQSWGKDWISRPPIKYTNTSKLTVKPGSFDLEDKPYGGRIWPTLRINGLGKNEVVSILEFAPVQDNQSWPPEGSHTDIPSSERNSSSWLHLNHTKALFKHYPATTLWQGNTNNDVMSNGRPSLNQVLQRLQLKRGEAIKQPWRLRIVVHEMKRIETMPLRQLWTQGSSMLIRPGMKMELAAIDSIYKGWEMKGNIQRISSAVLPIEEFRNTFTRGREVNDDFLFVLEDRVLQENYADTMFLSFRSQRSEIWWIHDEDQSLNVRLHQPPAQKIILKRTLDEWIDQQDASIWHAEERGIVEFQLTSEQMSEIIPKLKTKKK